MKQKKKKKEAPEEFIARLDELEFKTTASAADPKKYLCNMVLKAFRDAVDWYEIDKVYQTDLKPISVLALDYLFPNIYGKKIKDAFLHVNNMDEDRHRKAVLAHLKKSKRFEYMKGECVVDLNIMRGNKDPYKSIITAESEAYSPYAKSLNRNAGIDDNDMLWDLYKLLLYPSPYRLFITLSSIKHHKDLLSATSRIIRIYANNIKPGKIFAVQIPTGNLKTNDCLVAYWDEKRLTGKPIWVADKLLKTR